RRQALQGLAHHPARRRARDPHPHARRQTASPADARPVEGLPADALTGAGVYDVSRHLSPMSRDITRVRARGFEPPPPKGPGPKPGASASSATPACVAGPAVYLLLAASATRGA